MTQKALISIRKEEFSLDELIDTLICIRNCDMVAAEAYTSIINTASYEPITEIHTEIDSFGKTVVIFS